MFYSNFKEEYDKADNGDTIVLTYRFGRAVDTSFDDYVNIRTSEITDLKVIKKPFDWKDVKPGMAFKTQHGCTLLFYIGEMRNGMQVLEDSYGTVDFYNKCHLSRLREKDIK